MCCRQGGAEITFLGNADLHMGDSQGKRTPVCAHSQMRRRNRVRQIEPKAQHRRGSGRTAYTQASHSGDWRCKEPFISWLPINRNPDVLSSNGGWHVRPDVEYKIDGRDRIRKSDC